MDSTRFCFLFTFSNLFFDFTSSAHLTTHRTVLFHPVFLPVAYTTALLFPEFAVFVFVRAIWEWKYEVALFSKNVTKAPCLSALKCYSKIVAILFECFGYLSIIQPQSTDDILHWFLQKYKCTKPSYMLYATVLVYSWTKIASRTLNKSLRNWMGLLPCWAHSGQTQTYPDLYKMYCIY